MEILFDSFKQDWDEWAELIEELDNINESVKITGTLGLWNGIHEIIPVKCDTISEAINKCIGRDTNDIIFKADNESYYIDCYHHDGINKFKIKINDNNI